MSQPPQPQVNYVQGPILAAIPQLQQQQQQQQRYQFQLPAHLLPHPTSQYQTATPFTLLNSNATPVDCPACRQREMTNVTFVNGGMTHTWACLICWATLLFGWVPYMMDSLKDAEHRCGSCGHLLAKWHRNGGVVEEY